MIYSKIFRLLGTAIVFAFLTSCSDDLVERGDNLTRVIENQKTQFDYMDSLIYVLADSLNIECKELSCARISIKPETFRYEYGGEFVQNSNEPFTIYIEVDAQDDSYESLFYNSESLKFFVEIFYCNTYDCHDAEKIVIRSKDYKYVRLLKKNEFTISSLEKSDIYGAKGELNMFHLFNLKVNVDGLKLDWNVQVGICKYLEHDGDHPVHFW